MIVDSTTLISSINNAAYVSVNSTNVLSYNGSCDECICYAFFSNILFNSEALNCYKNNKTCLLFTNYISKSLIQIDLNSILLFKPLESLETTSESNRIHFNNRK